MNAEFMSIHNGKTVSYQDTHGFTNGHGYLSNYNWIKNVMFQCITVEKQVILSFTFTCQKQDRKTIRSKTARQLILTKDMFLMTELEMYLAVFSKIEIFY